MKQIIILMISLLLLAAPSVNAALIDNGDGTITDTSTNLMWLQDTDYAFTSGYDADGWMTWAESNEWAESLVFAGYDDWRLPDLKGQYCPVQNECIGSELGDMYHLTLDYDSGSPDKAGPFINLDDSDEFWFGPENYPSTDSVYVFLSHKGFQAFYPAGGEYAGAWAVRVVPEPISSTLFLVGGSVLGFRRFRKQ